MQLEDFVKEFSSITVCISERSAADLAQLRGT